MSLNEGVAEAFVLPAWVSLEATGTERDVGLLPHRPLLRRGVTNRRVRRLHQTGVGLDQAFLAARVTNPGVLGVGRQSVPRLGEHHADTFGDPVHISRLDVVTAKRTMPSTRSGCACA